MNGTSGIWANMAGPTQYHRLSKTDRHTSQLLITIKYYQINIDIKINIIIKMIIINNNNKLQ